MEPPASEAASKEPSAGDRPRRVIKRYSNRKLYDTKDSRYVTLLQIAEIVRAGEEVQIIDNTSKEDLTEVTLAQIIYEEQKAHARSVPLQTLKELLHQRTEQVLTELRGGPIGRLIPGPRAGGTDPPTSVTGPVAARPSDGEAQKPESAASVSPTGNSTASPTGKSPSLVDQAKVKLEDWQHHIDERVKAVLPSFRPWQQLEDEVKRLRQRVDELEAELRRRGEK